MKTRLFTFIRCSALLAPLGFTIARCIAVLLLALLGLNVPSAFAQMDFYQNPIYYEAYTQPSPGSPRSNVQTYPRYTRYKSSTVVIVGTADPAPFAWRNIAGRYTVMVTVENINRPEYTYTQGYRVYVTDGPPQIALNGAAEITLEIVPGPSGYQSGYVEEGATVTDNGPISSEVTITGTVDDAPGDYTLTYSATDAAGQTTEVDRIVHITSDVTPPVISPGDSTFTYEWDVDYGSTPPQPTAIDPPGVSLELQSQNNFDPIEAALVLNRDHTLSYTYDYWAVDAAGNRTDVTHTVNVVDTVPPFMRLLGDVEITLTVGDTFIDPGAEAVENEVYWAQPSTTDWYLDVTVSGSVNTSVAGDYELTYTATDVPGFTTEITRKVHVVDNPLLSAGLRWGFDEGSGATTASYPAGTDAAFASGVAWHPGAVGSNSIHLTDSADAYVEFPTGVGQFGTADFSVSFFLWTQETGQVQLVANRTTGAHGNFFETRMLAGGAILVSLDQDASGTNFVMAQSESRYNDGQWHLVTVRREGTALSLHIDGTEVASSESAGVTQIANANALRIGGHALEWASAPDIYIDEFRIYDYVLSAEEEVAILALNQYPAQ